MLVGARINIFCVLPQNGGSSLCSVDDSNDHVLSVWDWQKEEKLADVKVCIILLYYIDIIYQ